MSIDTLHGEIKSLIEKNGAMGVNQLSKALDVPLSTMQKYMDKQQTYFKKNNARKWVLPETAVETDMSVVSDNFSNVVSSQLQSMQALVDTLMSQFKATLTLMEANKIRSTPVAGIAPNIDNQLLNQDKKIKAMYVVFKKYADTCPEEYRDLLKGLDLYKLSIEMGTKFMNGDFNVSITSLFLKQSDTLSDFMIDILSEYQK